MRGDKLTGKFAGSPKAKPTSKTAKRPSSSSQDADSSAEKTASGGSAGQRKQADASPMEAYYDSGKNCYWVLNTHGEWMRVSEAGLGRRLRMTGLSKVLLTENFLTEVEDATTMIQDNQEILWAGQLAGYQAGQHIVCGQRLLITKGLTLPKPKKGQWPTLAKFLGELLGDDVKWFWGWAKAARQALANGPPFRAGQALALAGPSGCGKNLLQSIITEMLGGRAAKPYRYLTDKTSFNADLLAAEHLMVQDESPSRDMRARRALGANLKNICVNEVQSFHPKGKDAISVSVFWRLTISVNEDPEDLMVLPPLEASIRDKIILLRCFMPEFPFGPDDISERTAFRKKLSDEIPAFLAWLKAWSIPDEMKDIRYGVRAYQEGSLVEAVDDLANETHFWYLILNSDLFNPCKTTWEGTSTKLEDRLRAYYRQGEVDKVLTFLNAAGTYLGRLAMKMPKNIVQGERKKNERIWTLTRPDDLPWPEDKEIS